MKSRFIHHIEPNRSENGIFDWSVYAFEQVCQEKSLLVQSKLDSECIPGEGTAIINFEIINPKS